VQDEKTPSEWVEVARSGKRVPVALSSATALAYAKNAATAFGVGADQRVAFKKELAQADLKELDKKRDKKAKDAA
jgi:hypothetical protein